MTTMVIQADFPLGTFLGHRDVGSVSRFPDTARLHGALVHAAGKGMCAEEVDGDLRPAASVLAALTWLEEHPPEALCHPPYARVSGRPARSWRKEGVFENTKGKPAERRVLKAQSDAVAVAGPFAWQWSNVPGEVVAALSAVALDVSCLGEADSPVVLRVLTEGGLPATHRLDRRQSGFPEPGGMGIRTPVTGRVAELEYSYGLAHPVKRPPRSADKFSWGQQPRSHVPPADAVRDLTYRPVEHPIASPWGTALVIPVSSLTASGDVPRSFLDPLESVSWSVVMHRALVSRLGDTAPPIITGRYPKTLRPPANRIAIHTLAASAHSHLAAGEAAFVVLLPPDMTTEELAALHRSLAAVSVVRRNCRGSMTVLRLGEPVAESADSFWQPPHMGVVRFWRPVPALVPEARRQRSGSRPWSLADGVKLAIGHVFRETLYPGGKRPSRPELVERVEAAGVRVHEPHLIRDSNTSRYVHKVPEGLTVQPLTTLLDLGELAGPRTLVALGQSRHLGSGLLYPEDVAEPAARARGLL